MKKKLKKFHTLQGDPAGGGDSAGGGDGAGGGTDGSGTAGTEMIKSFCIVGVVASNGLRVLKYIYMNSVQMVALECSNICICMD